MVLQLVDQNRIGLDDPVGRYLPGVIPAGGTITIRELLQHRSGLDNYTDYPLWMDQAERSPSIRPIDALRFAASQPLLFPAGSQWAYSNTNYIALGLVIEKVTGHPFGQELRQRILKPLALSQTELQKRGDCRTSTMKAPIQISHGRREGSSLTPRTWPAFSRLCCQVTWSPGLRWRR